MTAIFHPSIETFLFFTAVGLAVCVFLLAVLLLLKIWGRGEEGVTWVMIPPPAPQQERLQLDSGNYVDDWLAHDLPRWDWDRG